MSNKNIPSRKAVRKMPGDVYQVPTGPVKHYRATKQYTDYDPGFMDELSRIPGGSEIKGCIQCGTCSGSCPTSFRMDYTPREIFAMTRAGMKDEVLSSNTPWLCASCYSCTVRCPKEIKITDIMYALKRSAVRNHKFPAFKAPRVAEEFTKVVRKYGRNYEVGMLTKFFLFVNPRMLPNAIPKGMKLFFKGRMPLFPKKIKGMDGLRKIMDKASQLGG